MKYYIIKPKSSAVDQKIIEGIKEIDKNFQIVNNLCECDVGILQKGWTRSKNCIIEKDELIKLHKACYEAYLYTSKYRVRLN